MKFNARIRILLTLCLVITCCFPTLWAKQSTYEKIMQYDFSRYSVRDATTSGSINFQPQLSIYRQARNSKDYIIINVNDPYLQLYVNGSSSGIVNDGYCSYYYQVNYNGTYEVVARAANGRTASASITINLGNYTSDIDLRKEYRNGNCYLLIDVYNANNSIRGVYVNGQSIPYNSSGRDMSYRVYSSGDYTVKVVDSFGYERTRTIYISVDDKAPTLSLSKKQSGDKWYLVIKANTDYAISSVTIDGSAVSFPSGGGTRDYEVTKKKTYYVKVTDKYGNIKSDSIYIDVDEKKDSVSMPVVSSVSPTVKVSQNYKINGKVGWYLIIKAQDNGSITSVRVNGEEVQYDPNKGYALYYVPIDGTYTIDVTDNDGNTTTASTFAAGNTYTNGLSMNETSSSQSGTDIVFKLNSKKWTKNGVEQERMAVAPRMIRTRVYLPIRHVGEALGIANSNISWNSEKKTVTILDSSNVVQVKVGSKVMNVNGESVTMDGTPVEINGCVMVPVSQIRTAFKYKDANLIWDSINKELRISR